MLAAIALCGAAGGLDSGQEAVDLKDLVVETSHGEAWFASASRGGNLRSLSHGDRTITFDDTRPAWQLHFRRLADGQPPGITVSPSDPGLLSLRIVDITGQEPGLTLRYSGRASLAGELVDFEVQTRWRPQGEELRGRIEVGLSWPHPATEGELHYLSYVRFPNLTVHALEPGGRLALPMVGGFLYEKPLEVALDRPEPGLFSFPAAAYYGEDGRLLYLSNTDRAQREWGYFKRLAFRGDVRTNTLSFSVEQHPEVPRSCTHYASPYEVVVAHVQGDWIDAALRYRRFLESEAPSYRGPIGKAGNGTSTRLKQATFVATIHQLADSSVLATHGAERGRPIVPDMMNMAREGRRYRGTLGDGQLIWYGYYFPDFFDCFYRTGDLADPSRIGYLPGHRNLEAALAWACGEEGLGQLIAPYVQGSVGWDPTSQVPPGPVNAYNEKIAQAAIIKETGAPMRLPLNGHLNVALCPGDPFWREELPRVVGTLLGETGFGSTYLDFFGGAWGCFAEHHGHPVGYGSWFAQAKLDQVKRIRRHAADLGHSDFFVSAESVLGAFTSEIEQMYIASFSNCSFAAKEDVIGIPLFRMAHDDVVIGRLAVEDPPYAGGTGWAAFKQAVRVLQHGQILSMGSFVTDGAEAWAWGTFGGEPYGAYLMSLAFAMQDGGFGPYLKGRMARAPQTAFSPPGDLRRFPAGPHADGVVSSKELASMVRVADLGLFPHGMYRHADDPRRYLWVVTNPWLRGSTCPFAEGPIDGKYEATFDLSRYPGLRDSSVVTNHRRIRASTSMTTPPDFESPADTPTQRDSGSVTVQGNLAPGETHLWFLGSGS